MTPVAEGQDTYLAEHARFMRGRGEAAPAWLKAMREKARDAFAERRLPDDASGRVALHERVAPIAATPFQLAEGRPPTPPRWCRAWRCPARSGW